MEAATLPVGRTWAPWASGQQLSSSGHAYRLQACSRGLVGECPLRSVGRPVRTHFEVAAGFDPVSGKRRRAYETFHDTRREAEAVLAY